MKQCISGAPVDEQGVCKEHGETACVLTTKEYAPWNPIGWIDKLTSRSARRATQQERSLVREGPEAAKQLVRRDMIYYLTTLAVMMGVVWHGWWSALLAPVLGGLVGYAGISRLKRARAYRTGWLDGRQRMLLNAPRHRDASSFFKQEMDHDLYHVLGLPHLVPDDLEGLDD